MKKNTFIICCICLLMLYNHATAQIHLNVFSYSEFFHAPNLTFSKQKMFSPNSNEFNFSSNIGISIRYQWNRQWSVSLGAQRVTRRLDWDCVGIIRYRDMGYIFNPDTCQYKMQAVYNEIQIPISIIYSFQTANEYLTHSIGVGNTTFYHLNTDRLLFNDTMSHRTKGDAYPIYTFAPELFYQLDAKLYKNVSLNAIIGVRKEGFNVPNYAIFGKLGLGYLFHRTQKAKKKGRKR